MNIRANEDWKKRLCTPAYRVGEAASYARISPQTVAAWEQTYNDRRAVVTARQPRQGLNFLQLIEVAVVAELRRAGLSLKKIRDARAYFTQVLGTDTPFATHQFKTDGVDILQEMNTSAGELISDRLLVANANGQLAWADFLGDQFKEFNYGEGIVVSWRLNGPDSDLVIDPQISFGSPSVRGVMTRAIKNEFVTGTSIKEIADDFDLPIESVKEALKFEGLMLEGTTRH